MPSKKIEGQSILEAPGDHYLTFSLTEVHLSNVTSLEIWKDKIVNSSPRILNLNQDDILYPVESLHLLILLKPDTKDILLQVMYSSDFFSSTVNVVHWHLFNNGKAGETSEVIKIYLFWWLLIAEAAKTVGLGLLHGIHGPLLEERR